MEFLINTPWETLTQYYRCELGYFITQVNRSQTKAMLVILTRVYYYYTMWAMICYLKAYINFEISCKQEVPIGEWENKSKG